MIQPEPDARGSIGLLVLLAAVVAGVVLAAHWPALSAQAVSLDDPQYLSENPLVRNPGWASAKRFLFEVSNPSTVGGYYQPLTMISLMLDYAMGGRPEHPRTFHRTSLVLHAANTVLIIMLLYQLFGRPWPAAMVGLLFGVHPLTVETIPWIGERKTLLATFFVLWCLILYVRMSRGGEKGDIPLLSRKRSDREKTRMSAFSSPLDGKSARAKARGSSGSSGSLYVTCVVLYLLALLAKPTSTPLPVVLILLDYWPLRRLGKKSLIEKIPFFLLSGVFAVITTSSQGLTVAVSKTRDYSPLLTPAVYAYTILSYFKHTLWPVGLSLVYPFPEPLSMANPLLAGSLVGMVVLAGLTWWTLRRRPAYFTGLLIFLTILAPTLLVSRYSWGLGADKYVYLPALGLLIVLTWLLSRLWDRHAEKRRQLSKQALAIVAVSLLAAAEVFATRRQLTYWQTSVDLRRRISQSAPNVPDHHLRLAEELALAGRMDEAFAEYEASLRVGPDYREGHNNLAWILATHPDQRYRDGARAITHAKRACELAKTPGPALLDTLAAAYAEAGRFDEAIRIARHAAETAARIGNPKLAEDLFARLKLYQAGQAYRERSFSTPPSP